MIKGYKIRIYPNKEQEVLLWKHIGACRFIWNYMLNLQEENYKNGEKYISGFSMGNILPALKKEKDFLWLNEVSAYSLKTVCRDLDFAYQAFFKRIRKRPVFKSRKKSKTSYPIREERMYFEEKTVKIEKLGKIKYKTDFNLPLGSEHKFSNARISNINGKWMLSFGIEYENQVFNLIDSNMGIDLGVKDLAIVALDEDKQFVFHNINKSKKIKDLKKKLVHTQRSISRKYEANKQGNKFIRTKNIMKEEDKLRKLYTRISNIRMNYLHQTTHFLVSLLPQRVVMEDLNIQGMMKNHHLSKAIQEQCLYEFKRQMKYKCEWRGIEFVLADRFYPSSKTCSCCGEVKKNLKLKDRTYICEKCGLIIDRDYNAALNLSKYMI